MTLIDVGSITGTDHKPVERHLCGPPGDLANPAGTLPAGSLDGKIALVSRGLCPTLTKDFAAEEAGAVGLILVDNRSGDDWYRPFLFDLPGGTISDLDGANLRAYVSGQGGTATITLGGDVEELETGRSGVITSFSSAGPTVFGHLLKPDISAPGGQIISSTSTRVDPTGFAVFNGTSMAAPHVAGSAALLLELHPTWTPAEVKSALMSTASPAWSDTARTVEAPVTEEGGGLVWLPTAADPLVFTAPASLSFGDVDALHGTTRKALVLEVSDAGNGSGPWSVSLDPQSVTSGATLDVPGVILLPPGGETDVPVVARVGANAAQGDDYGFVVLKQGSDVRRVPYLFHVSRPALAALPVKPLVGRSVKGDTSFGSSAVTAYRFPSNPFGSALPFDYPPDTPLNETGSESVYSLLVRHPVANAGVSIVEQTGLVDPWFLGADDENTVQGYTGTPIDTRYFGLGLRTPAAGVSFPSAKQYYVAVDSGSDTFTGASYAGRYVLRSWVNDVTPPSLRVLTTRVTAGRPLIAIHARDWQSGVNPSSLEIAYYGFVIRPVTYDRASGIALFPLRQAPKLRPGRLKMLAAASDYAATKNIFSWDRSIFPNFRVASKRIRVVRGPTADWLSPTGGHCIRSHQPLLVTADTGGTIDHVRFFLDGRRVASGRHSAFGLWRGRLGQHLPGGKHRLKVEIVARSGATASRSIPVHRCG